MHQFRFMSAIAVVMFSFSSLSFAGEESGPCKLLKRTHSSTGEVSYLAAATQNENRNDKYLFHSKEQAIEGYQACLNAFNSMTCVQDKSELNVKNGDRGFGPVFNQVIGLDYAIVDQAKGIQLGHVVSVEACDQQIRYLSSQAIHEVWFKYATFGQKFMDLLPAN